MTQAAGDSEPSRLVRVAGVAAAVSAAFAATAFVSDSSWQAPFRIAVALVVCVFAPAAGVMRVCGWFGNAEGARERIPLAFAIGYGLLTVLCAISVTLELSLAQAAAAISVVAIALALLPSRSRRPQGRDSRLMVVMIVLVAVCGWFLEPAVDGEETVEVISIRKISENPRLSLDGLMAEPHSVPTYIITPPYFFAAIVAKLSGVSIIPVYLKLRALYAALAILVFAGLASRLFRHSGYPIGEAVGIGVAILFLVDPAPWSWPASAFPLVRRGALAAGVLAPTAMLATLIYCANELSGRRPIAGWLAPGLLLLSLLTTHALEVLYVMFFLAAVVVSRVIVRNLNVSIWRLVEFIASVGVVAVMFKIVHPRLVPHVYLFDEGRSGQALLSLKAQLSEGLPSFFGISPEGDYLIAVSGALLPFTILGICLMPVLIRLDRSCGTVIWLATLIPLAVYSSSKMFALLQLVTSSEVLFVFSYFNLLGVTSFLIVTFVSLNAVMHRWVPASSTLSFRRVAVVMAITFAVAWSVAGPLLLWLAAPIFTYPLALPWVLGLGGLAAASTQSLSVAIEGRRWVSEWAVFSAPGPRRPLSRFAIPVFIAALAGLGLTVGHHPFSTERPATGTIWGELVSQWSRPSVFDWENYYPILQASTKPPLDLPLAVVRDLERLLPPLQTLIADPAHSFALPVVLNQHIVNPGHRISTSLEYFERFTNLDATGQRWHPIFNATAMLSEREREFLRRYQVQYVLANPQFQTVLRQKLPPPEFELLYERDGFSLYRCRIPS